MDQSAARTRRIECLRQQSRFQEHTPPGNAVLLYLLKFAFVLARFLCATLRLVLDRRQTQGYICQFQIPIAFFGFASAKPPIALIVPMLKAEGRSNPQVALAISIFIVPGLLRHSILKRNITCHWGGNTCPLGGGNGTRSLNAVAHIWTGRSYFLVVSAWDQN